MAVAVGSSPSYLRWLALDLALWTGSLGHWAKGGGAQVSFPKPQAVLWLPKKDTGGSDPTFQG